MPKLVTTEIFIKRAKLIHKDKYDYSLVDYKHGQTKIIIICLKHGKFEQRPNDHLQGKGCDTCARSIEYNSDKTANEIFIQKAKLIHKDKYDYSLVEYKNSRSKINIICPIHGIFKQIPNTHLSGGGCLQCYYDRIPNCLTKSTEQFITNAKIIHNDRYDYSKVKYSHSNTPVEIICKKHGSFFQKPSIHLCGKGCKKCNSSKGEISIQKFLQHNNISYEVEKYFSNCIHIRYLRFDFYLPTYNICIEFDGRQHYKPENYYGGKESFEQNQIRDAIKTKYCADNNIKLIRIPYWDFDNIEIILSKELNC